MSSVDIEVEFSEVIYFAAAYNRRPVISSLIIRSTSGEVFSDVEITIDIESLGDKLAQTWTQGVTDVGSVPKSWTTNEFREFRLDANLLHTLTDQRRGELVVRVLHGGAELGVARHPVNVLAANAWVRTESIDVSALDLAAFVMPNHPALRPVLAEASALLAKAGESSGLSGYQGTLKHIDTMVECIYEAVRSLSITYSDPLASSDMYHDRETGGQRIRTPGEVVGDRVGTCLDTATLFAALLENVGLHPVIVVVPGHAFVGYWRSETSGFPDPVFPVRDGINSVDVSADLRLFETTTVCGGQQSVAFATALASGRSKIDSHDTLSEIGGLTSRFVDISRARLQSGIYPIPARHAHPDGSVELVEYKPQEFSINLLTEALAAEGGTTKAGLQANDAPQRVKNWKNALLDLSLRNPLINYRFPAASSATLLLPASSLGAVEDLLQNGHELHLLPNLLTTNGGEQVSLTGRNVADDHLRGMLETTLVTRRSLFTTISADAFVSRLRRINSAAKSIIDETGNNNLYLAMGTLVWQPEGKAEVRSPLILVPITLKAYNRSKEFRLSIDQSSSVTPNFSLAEKLSKDVGLKLDRLVEPELDNAGVDIDGLIAYVREELKKADLHGFRVDETCTLGFFDFSTYRLWRDLSDYWPTLIKNPLVSHLVHTPFLEFTDPVADDTHETGEGDLDDLTALLPVQSDGSQALAVRKAIAGQTFVLQGPPGTGKSQTITNLLAHALHSGKRVLFIAEKSTALNVVKERLEEVGLAPFCLDLHDKGMRPTAVRQQLSAVLDVAMSSDRIGYEAAQNDRARAVAPLRRYPERLHARGKFGESAYSAHDKLLASPSAHALTVDSAFLSSATLDSVAVIKQALRDLADVGANAGMASTNPWSLATVPPPALTPEVRSYLGQVAGRMSVEHTWLASQAAARSFLEGLSSLPELSELARLATQPLPPLSTIDSAATPEASAGRSMALQLLAECRQLPPEVCPQTALAPVDDLWAAAQTAMTSFFLGRPKKVDAVCRSVEAFLTPGTAVAGPQLTATLAMISGVQGQMQRLRQHTQGLAGVVLPEEWNPLESSQSDILLQNLATLEASIAFAHDDGTTARSRLRAFLTTATQDEIVHLGTLGQMCRDVLSVLGANDESLRLWQGAQTPGAALTASIDSWQRDAVERGLVKLQRWSALTELLDLLTQNGLEPARQQLLSGAIPFIDAEPAFEHGFLNAVFRRQLDDENLDAFDGRSHDTSVRANGRATEQLRNVIPGILGEDLLAARGFSGTVTVGAVGELKRELNRTRGGKPIRRLLKEHWHVISKLTPCVLASPDSAVRFLDAELEPFDLVVFDEASQIRVPHAIGALGRSRASVVVGDSRQMPPTSVAQVAAAIDDDAEIDESFVVDEESILSESVQARVPDLMLSWHYRSEDESLIAFSNHQYYDGNLSSFPSATESLTAKGVSFVKVEGQFLRAGSATTKELRTNPIEARAIVAEIVRRLHDPALSQFSIGVVTFNQPQQALVLTLLQDLDDDLVQSAMTREIGKEELQVWNLESVQGHERDVILFSIAFSKNSTGVIPLQFGPLVNAGGERRLNVAVTRAKRQVVVFCSFEPSELNVEGTSSLGLRHLKAYLELAKHGPQASGAVSGHAIRPPDRHRDEVLGALIAGGLRAVPDVGLSGFKVDIAIVDPDDPDRRVLGILLDGEAWHKRPTVGDRDVLPASLLRGKMGWSAIERIWMPMWLRDPHTEVARIVELVETLKVEAAAGAPVEAAAPVATVEPPAPSPTADLGARHILAPSQEATGRITPSAPAPSWPDIKQWTASPTTKAGEPYYLDQLTDPATVAHLQAFGAHIVNEEGPMAPKRFARVIGQAHGMQRLASKRVDDILRTPMPSLITDDEGFFFPIGNGPEVYSGWSKSQSGGGRPVEEISLSELGNALRDIARVGLGATQEEIVRAAAQAFGIGRVTTGIRDRIEKALLRGIGDGKLGMRGEHVVAE